MKPALLLFGALGVLARAAFAGELPPAARDFLEAHCFDCHDAETKKGGLDLTGLPFDAADGAAFEKWVRAFDRTREGEMPPKKKAQPARGAREEFLAQLGAQLTAEDARRQRDAGRVRARRLSRAEYENTMHGLLGIDLPLRELLPDDAQAHGFDTEAAAQMMSDFQLEKYLAAADAALDAAWARAFEPLPVDARTFTARQIARRNLRSRNPEGRGDTAVAWSSMTDFHGRMLETGAPATGWYRVRARLSAVNAPASGSIWAMLNSGTCFPPEPTRHWIGAMEVTPEPREFEFEAFIQKKHLLELRPADDTLRRATLRDTILRPDGTLEPMGIPGVAIEWVKMERIHRGLAPEAMRRRLFGELACENGEVLSTAPREDAARLMEAFAARAFRRPVTAVEVAPYTALVQASLAGGESFAEALRGGYRALLTSMRFLYFQETPGALDDFALASRLSYFLWSTLPDDALLERARAGRLRDAAVLRGELERLLADPRARAFTERFTAQWLNLQEIDFTDADDKLYPEFDLVLKHSMLAETHAFFDEMLRRDLSATHVVDSDFALLDRRLAKHYGVPWPGGEGMRRVALAADGRRGGIITQGSVLKVTANGTTSSPVLRGVWMMERILGQHVPPVPDGVPAVEPDIRGAKTIREQLDKHRTLESCATCHVKIDPLGFALESYDVIGGWRENYRALRPVLHRNAQASGEWRPGLAVDASGTFADGAGYRDIAEFKRLLLRDPDQLARNLASQLAAYATGAHLTFADRAELEEIVAASRKNNHGLRSLLHAVVQSQMFRHK